MAGLIPQIQNGEQAGSVRQKLNRLIDVGNEALSSATFVGPPGPPGPPGVDGLKGDPGNYTGMQLNAVLDSTSDLPLTGNPGDAYGIPAGETLELWAWTNTGWVNYGSINPLEERNVQNCVFVAPDGNDDLDGRTFGKSVRSLEAAVEIATNLAGKTPNLVSPTTVFVYPGHYKTQGHLDWPDRCTIFGVGGARKTVIEPGPVDEDGDPRHRNVFRLGDGGYVEGFGFHGFEVHNPAEPSKPFEDPFEGFAIAFRPGAVVNRVPYAHNITVYQSFPPRSLISPPLDRRNGNPLVGIGGGVAIADGAVVSQYSAFPNIMTWGATPSVPNGIGYLAKRGGFLNPVNAVALWAHRHFMVQSGAQMVLSSCSSQFGDYSLWAEGTTTSVRPAKLNFDLFPDFIAAGAIVANMDAIIDQTMEKVMQDPRCGCACSEAEYEKFGRTDLSYLLRSLQLSVRSGNVRPMQQFARGLFDWQGNFYSPGCELVWVGWYEFMKGVIANYVSGQGTRDMINALITMVQNTLEQQDKKLERSLLTSINHQWTYPLAGVTRDALPTRYRSSGRSNRISRSVVQRNGGRVRYSGQDDEGNAVFVGGLEIEARSGELRGPPFEAAVRKRATRITFARGFR